MTTGRINQVAAFCWAGPGLSFHSKGKVGPSSLQSAVRHSKLSASAVQWIPPLPPPAAGRTGIHLLSCPHCIAPRPERARIEALGPVHILNSIPELPSPGASRQEASRGRSLSGLRQRGLSREPCKAGSLHYAPIHTHGVSIQVPPLPSTARTSRRPRLGGGCH